MGPKMESWLQDFQHRVQQTLPKHRKPSYRKNKTLEHERCCTQTTSQPMEYWHNVWQSWEIYKSSNLLFIKPPLFSLLCIGTLAEKDTPCHELVLFHPVLKAYPTCHSWIITAHISIGNLDRWLCMFNRQKTLAHQLLVKIQNQLLVSQLVANALLDIC